ncbi:MAG TPA: ribonuclease T [Methyloceanibacter sp.]|nr:ribonuclease T [Methyloceanibacter sp.]
MPIVDLRVFGAAIAAAWLLAGSAAAYDDGLHAYRYAEPGDFDYYVLVLGWSPTDCLKEGDKRRGAQCNTELPHDFVLHGLWPQYAKGWPEDCYQGKRPWIPSQVLDEMHPIMPSKGLIIHEYTAHGTCTGLTPAKYFDAARIVYEQVNVPAGFDDPDTQRFLSPDTIEAEFIAANAWLKPDMIAVTCRRGNLFDIRLCFDRDLAPQACGANEVQKRLCPLARITVPAP